MYGPGRKVLKMCVCCSKGGVGGIRHIEQKEMGGCVEKRDDLCLKVM